MSSPQVVVPPLTLEIYEALRTRLGLSPSLERGSLFPVVEEVCRSVAAALQQLASEQDSELPTRRFGRRPLPVEDPLNAIVHVIEMSDGHANEGPMRGMRVAIKDNIPLAGVPMTMGSTAFNGYVPAEDALVVRRLLAAGGCIVATTNMESFALSASGEMSDYGRVRNPFDNSRTVSGSSSGGAAALWYNNVDVSFGTDTGGSCRLPAGWAGVLGLKPTHGLIPYEGVPTADKRLDHIGIMARTVDNLARALEGTASWSVVEHDSAGEATMHMRSSFLGHESTDRGVRGTRFGFVTAAFAEPGRPDAVGTAEALRAAKASLENLKALGANLRAVDLDAVALSDGIMFASLAESVSAAFQGAPSPYQWTGGATPKFANAMSTFMRECVDHLPPSAQTVLIAGAYFHQIAGGGVSAAVHATAERLRLAVDAALEDVDMLLIPTASHLPLVAAECLDDEQKVRRGWGMSGYAGLFNFTGHPVLSMPIAEYGGLPVGVSFVGRHYSEAHLLRVARAVESCLGWKPHSPGAN